MSVSMSVEVSITKEELMERHSRIPKNVKGGEIYHLIHHYDVWGNEEDGYEVNDSSSHGFIIINDFEDDSEICEFLGAYFGEELEIKEGGELISLNNNKDIPICSLHKIEQSDWYQYQ